MIELQQRGTFSQRGASEVRPNNRRVHPTRFKARNGEV